VLVTPDIPGVGAGRLQVKGLLLVNLTPVWATLAKPSKYKISKGLGIELSGRFLASHV
jgi:hypothetical protein